jgi:hypothetical protein
MTINSTVMDIYFSEFNDVVEAIKSGSDEDLGE